MALDMNAVISMIFISLLCFSSLAAQKSINVGVYQNAPKIFMDTQGNPSGYFIDILNEIALQEKWKLHVVSCQWSQCLEMLKKGEIDILPDVAYTFEREKTMVFSQEVVLSSWSILYRHKNVKIDSILDLEQKRIAVLREGVQYSATQKVLNSYNITPHSYVQVQDFSEAFRLLANKKVDCVVTNRFYELSHELGKESVKTNILLESSMLKFAFSPSQNHLANSVDFHLRKFKKNPSSVLYEAEKKWITPKNPTQIPNWLLWSIAGGFFLIVLLSFLVWLFQRMVTKKSLELLQKEDLLIIQSRHAAMGEMIAMIAHQWRQPLSIISMSASNIRLSLELEEEIKTKVLEEHLKTVAHYVQYLSTTIDDFRNFFKPNKTTLKIHISHILNELTKILHVSFVNNNITLIIHNDDDFEIKTFANELLQVVLNLVNNAKDVLKEKHINNPTITLSTSQTNEKYTLSVCDNAGGIPADIIDKIGKQYFTTKSDQGTGLGLYMSIVILEQHLNGSLTWQNKEEGACFTVSIFK